MEIFLRILIAHIITDFFIQPDRWIIEKKEKTWKSKYLYFHVLLTGLLAWILLWDWQLWYIALGIAISHLLIDLYKLVFCDDNLMCFVIDQIFHLLVLIAAALIITEDFKIINKFLDTIFSPNGLLTIAGYLIVTTPLGYFIGKATKRWQSELTNNEADRDSLKDAGIWIGILERILVVTFVLFNQLQAIGFLIAAKSILRFSDKSEHNPRKQTEYVLIGTLLSFTMALFFGLLIRYFLANN